MKVGIYGLGSIGRLLALTALRRGHELVSAIDIDERIVGRDVGEVIGVERLGVVVSRDVGSLAEADVVLHATGSYLDRVFDQLVSVVDLGIDVVSTCETLAYPFYRYPVLARRLDELARRRGVAVIGTGSTPGFC